MKAGYTMEMSEARFSTMVSGLFLAVLSQSWLKEKKFVPKSFYSVIIAFCCFIIIRYTGNSLASRGIMVIAAICMGHIFASSLYTFFMLLNNSEKFYSMIMAVFLPKVLMIIKPAISHDSLAIDVPSVIIFMIIIILAVCSYLFRYTTDAIPETDRIKAPAKGLFPYAFNFYNSGIE